MFSVAAALALASSDRAKFDFIEAESISTSSTMESNSLISKRLITYFRRLSNELVMTHETGRKDRLKLRLSVWPYHSFLHTSHVLNSRRHASSQL